MLRHIILRLCIPQFAVLAVLLCKQPLMASLLHQTPLMKNQNFVTEAAGGKTVADVDCRLVLHNLTQTRINLILRQRVERSSRLVEYQESRIPVQGSRNRKLLRLAAGHLHPLLGQCALGNSNPLFYKASKISEITFSPLFFTFIL